MQMLGLPIAARKKKSRRPSDAEREEREGQNNGFYKQAFWFLTGALTVVLVLSYNRPPEAGFSASAPLPDNQGADKQEALRAQSEAPTAANASLLSNPHSSALPPPGQPHLDTPSPHAAAKIMMKKKGPWGFGFRSKAASEHAKWKTYFIRPHAGQFGKALSSRGWKEADREGDAEIMWYQKKKEINWGAIKPWQRVNHFKDETLVAHKGHMLDHLRKTKSEAQKYLPQSFALWIEEDRKGLKAAIEADLAAQREEWWVLKEPARDGGKGVKFAKDAAKLLTEIDSHKDEIAQRYVDNPLLLDGKKFDLRVYWAVVTSRYEPLVLYHPGSLRVSLTDYNSKDGPVGQLLTNAAQQGKGGHSDDVDEKSRQPLTALWTLLENHPNRPEWVMKAPDPKVYLECEMRKAISAVFQAFQEKVFVTGRAADTFALLGADFMIDQHLNIYLSEMQSGPGLPHNTKAVKDVMDVMIPGLASIVLHIRDAHLRGGIEVPFPLPPSNFDVIVNGSQLVLPSFCAA